MQVKIADLGVSNEFDGADALLTNTAGTPAFTGDNVFINKMFYIIDVSIDFLKILFIKTTFHIYFDDQEYPRGFDFLQKYSE